MTAESVIFPRLAFLKKSGVGMKVGLRLALLEHSHSLREEVPCTAEFWGRCLEHARYFPDWSFVNLKNSTECSVECIAGETEGVWLPSYPIRIASPHPSHRRLTFRQTRSQPPAQRLMQGTALKGFGICFVLPHAHILGLLVFIQ